MEQQTHHGQLVFKCLIHFWFTTSLPAAPALKDVLCPPLRLRKPSEIVPLILVPHQDKELSTLEDGFRATHTDQVQ